MQSLEDGKWTGRYMEFGEQNAGKSAEKYMEKRCGKKKWKRDAKKRYGKNRGKTWIFLRKKRGLAPDERTACRKNKESVDKK